MASRPVVQQQNMGEAFPAGAVKQKNMALEKKNRRALGDIGNVVTLRGVDVKALPQVSRPVTRSFCAKLLANAEAENKKNPLAVIGGDGAQPDKRAEAGRKPAKKKAAIKSKPEEIIVISPDSNEVAAKKEKKKTLNSKKKAPTLTSTLTARSKAACGLRNEPKEQIVDIDAADVDNDLAVVEYVEEMYKFYKSVENEGRAHAYMYSQPEINERMRAVLIDWRELQLVGLSAMLIASKYEEIWAPEVHELVCISDRTYTPEQILIMEKRILGELEWNLTVPTPYVFLVRFIKASMTDSDVENMVYSLAELGAMNYSTLRYCPSMVAASAVYAARCTLNKTPLWSETLRIHTGFSEQQLMDCAKLLVTFHSMAAEQKLRGIYRKYSCSERGAVALFPPASQVSFGCLSC
ncbi:G2/mitotic-specific cyclin-2 [Sesamum alatum]|uniref:G2/mitotic-specific cyclin-2 n=1 Tax=Sesamum alatum TaxID=300844 RepID=A0AAE1YKH6_9LAMI|nr:G2/mitotic-specific cyclin-2 [Sesamum alatum]